MLHLLIVDDEIHAVAGIVSALEWMNYQISSIFTANSMRQAKEIFLKNKIDIMICDIEMPNGSGLDLLNWVKESSPQTQAIFLTCHAEFPLIKKAMQLGSLDYLLKPATTEELDAAICHAIRQITKQNEMMKDNELAKYWVQNKSIIIERFWLDILNQNIPSVLEDIQKSAEERNINHQLDQTFLPILICSKKRNKDLNLRDKKIVEYALWKLANETFVGNQKIGHVVKWDESRILVIVEHANVNEYSSFIKTCNTYIQYFLQYFKLDVTCYIGKYVHIHQVAEMAGELKNLEKNHVDSVNKVLVYGLFTREPLENKVPNMMIWAEMLKQGSVKKVLDESMEYLNNLARNRSMDATFLHQFYQDFLQMFYYVLKVKGIFAHQLFIDSKSVEMSIQATESLNGLIEWMQYMVKKATGYVKTLEESRSVVLQVQTYIRQNLEHNLSREEIANLVHLNPDYLNRIFKKETGYTVSEFITNERIGLAKQLLTNTDLSITTVAASVGFTLPYFSKIFKKFTNETPLEYREHKDLRVIS
ncbi:response regulator [Bacillus sp. BRMEA1]|uniref:response regulator n=1 Tax=Neobacillus endophyticus TaxID=2738405 RepID=UPI00156678C4|nr:response regulator [Neobacillus endophyticus]NRD78297.1 response regulator [Neobacillus endophyticus]